MESSVHVFSVHLILMTRTYFVCLIKRLTINILKSVFLMWQKLGKKGWPQEVYMNACHSFSCRWSTKLVVFLNCSPQNVLNTAHVVHSHVNQWVNAHGGERMMICTRLCVLLQHVFRSISLQLLLYSQEDNDWSFACFVLLLFLFLFVEGNSLSMLH